MIGRLKAYAEWLACRSWIGTLISRLHGDWIRSPSVPRGFRAVHVCAPRGSVSDATRASLFWGFHEAQEIRYIERYVAPNLDVIELGASLGVVSAHIAKRLGRNQHLTCVEANPGLVALISKTIERNAPNANVEIVTSAIGYGADTVRFDVSEDVITSHVSQGGIASIEVPAIRLSAVVGSNAREFCLVCDIEGSESQILDQDAASLRGSRLMIMELHASPARSVEQMVQQIKHLGFRRRDNHGAVYVFDRL